MFDIEKYMEQLIAQLREKFGPRLLYVGLQESYLRGEATVHSDIDAMVVIDGLCVSDLRAYRSVIESMEHYDRSCGFICGKTDLAAWNPMEICHVLHSTKDYFGTLSALVPAYTQQDIRNFVKMSVNNLYHEICHRYIHADAAANREALPFTYKGVFYILQNLHYLTSGTFIGTKRELLPRLDGKNHAVLERAMSLAAGDAYDFDDSFALLFDWCQETMKAI